MRINPYYRPQTPKERFTQTSKTRGEKQCMIDVVLAGCILKPTIKA